MFVYKAAKGQKTIDLKVLLRFEVLYRMKAKIIDGTILVRQPPHPLLWCALPKTTTFIYIAPYRPQTSRAERPGSRRGCASPSAKGCPRRSQ